MSLVAEVAPPVRLGHGIGLYGAVALATSALGPAVAEPIADALRRAAAVPACPPRSALAGAWFCRRLPAGARRVVAATPRREARVRRGAQPRRP